MMADVNCYKFVADPAITTYQLAQILAAGTFWVSPENYEKLPSDVQVYFVEVSEPVVGE